MKLQLTLPLVLHLALSSATTGLKPKMVGQPIEDSNRRLKDKIPKKTGSELMSHNAIFMGTCSSGGTFSFPVGGGSGRGAIALMSPASNSYVPTTPSLTFDENTCEGCLADITGTGEPNVFGFQGEGVSSDDGLSFPLEYKDIPPAGTSLTLACEIDADVLIILKDTNTDVAEDVQAEVTWSPGNNGKTRQTVKIKNGKVAKKSLTGVAKKNKNKHGNQNVAESSNVWVSSGSNTGITIEHNLKDEVVLVNFQVDDSTGNTVPRTFILETSEGPPAIFPFTVGKIEVNQDRDLELTFSGQPHDQRYLYQVRLGLQEKNKAAVEIVDYSAILDANEDAMIIHGSWIRKAVDNLGILKENGDLSTFDVVVTEGMAVDPEGSYQQVGELITSSIVLSASELPEANNDESKSRSGKLRRLLSTPSNEAKDEISMEMLQGRKPAIETTGLRRRLAGATKILVHGYCGSNPFPTSHFSNAVAFSFSGSGSNQWSHDTFAQNIDAFSNSYSSCGIVAHSQGGAAALHLYTYYWSCLDYATTGGSRLIQSVGTPYQGTPLAGTLAALGDIFGAGCGQVDDLTTGGASSWLGNIPSWARSKVHYYTTSFEDKWWRWDYCHIASDVLLNDPDDGTTEESKGQLPGANNRGHATNQCHTTGMRDPPQCQNLSRNSDMNANARY